MKAIIIALMAGALITGCTTTQSNNKVRVVQEQPKSNLPDIEVPEPVELNDVKWDVPRDTTKEVIRNTPECKAIPEDRRGPKFRAACIINPPIENTNIYLGVDQENYNNLEENIGRLSARDRQLRARIEEANRIRRENRQ